MQDKLFRVKVDATFYASDIDNALMYFIMHMLEVFADLGTINYPLSSGEATIAPEPSENA